MSNLNLTKLEKVKYLKALEEKNRRLKTDAERYKPNDGQMKVHLSNKKFRFVFAGNGSGKTTLAIHEAIWAATGYNPVMDKYTHVPAKIIIVLDHPDKIGDVWLPEFKKWYDLKPENMHKLGKTHVSEITFDNGSVIKFMTQNQDPMSFESMELDMAIYDEPPERNLFIALVRGGRKKIGDPKYMIIGTPLRGSWMRTEVYNRWIKGELPDHECFTYGTVVNKDNLREGYIEEYERVLSEKEAKVRLHGAFFDLDGLALAHLFRRDKHIIPFDRFERMHKNWRSYPVTVVIDPHPTKAHVAIAICVDKANRVTYLKEMASKSVARKFASDLKNFMKDLNVVDIVCDSLGNSELTGGEGYKSFIQILKEEGIKVRATDFEEKKDSDFIDRMRSVLVIPDRPDNFGNYIPSLTIIEGNIGIIHDIESAEWVRYKDIDASREKIDIRMLDYLAALKYGLASNLKHDKGKVRTAIVNRASSAYGFRANNGKFSNIYKKQREALKKQIDLYQDL